MLVYWRLYLPEASKISLQLGNQRRVFLLIIRDVEIPCLGSCQEITRGIARHASVYDDQRFWGT